MNKLSPNGKKIRFIKSLKYSKNRKKSSIFPVEGSRVVWELLNSNFVVEEIIFDITHTRNSQIKEIEELCENRNIDTSYVDNKLFSSIAFTRGPQGVMALARIPEERKIDFSRGKYVYLYKISDPGNLGTIIRSLNFFNFDALFLSENSVDLYNPKVVRAAMGSLFKLPIYENAIFDNVKNMMDKNRIKSYALMPDNGIIPEKIEERDNILLVFGPETGGLHESIVDKCDMRIRIDGNENVESLNLGIAVSIMAFFCR